MLKQLELSFRRFLLKLLQRRTSGALASLSQLPENAKILLLRHDKIGDVLVTVPMIRILRKRFPNAQIDILLGEKNQSAFGAVQQYCNHKLLYSKKLPAILSLIRSLWATHYDVIIDCMDNPSSTSRTLIALSAPRYSVGLVRGEDTFYTHPIPTPDRRTTHIVERTAQLLTAFGIEPAPEDLSLEFPMTEAQQAAAHTALGEKTGLRLGINISAGWEKYWGRERLIELVTQLQGIEIIGFATADFQSELQEITKQASAMRAAPLAGSLSEFAAMLHECDVLFTPDTSVVHLAAAWKKPCVVLYANITDDLMLWTPYKSPHRALTTRESVLPAIGSREVVQALQELIEENFPGER